MNSSTANSIQDGREKEMTKVITYGTYDMLHYGHIRLLERARNLGDYLIVGVTSSDYDKYRGKINVEQPLIERIKAVKDTGLADEIIIEEYEGQKIDDIISYGVDIFAIGSDWEGKFDYLNEYCKVVYLDRTEGISSSKIRSKENKIRIGFAGDADQVEFMKYCSECRYVNGVEAVGIYPEKRTGSASAGGELLSDGKIPAAEGLPDGRTLRYFDSYDALLEECDAVYLAPHPRKRYKMVQTALLKGKHVLCKSPAALDGNQCKELTELAIEKNLILMDAIKTAYSTAYNRLRLLVKSGKIGKVMSINATITSLAEGKDSGDFRNQWNTIDAWGPIAMLPVFQMLGTGYRDVRYICSKDAKRPEIDAFMEMSFIYPSATANIILGNGVKAEGDLVVSGTKGYIYVPAPWWKTDYFEVRYEDPSKNARYFYQLEGEGIRFELVTFVRSVRSGKFLADAHLDKKTTECISETISNYYKGMNVIELEK